MGEIPSHDQQIVDAYYSKHGPCCAGCDHWHRINTLVGECHRSAPVAAAERYAMLGISWTSLPGEAGHVLTRREHRCGDFVDTFDWSGLPALYLRRIGRA